LLFVKRILKRKDDEFQDVTLKFEVFKQQSSTKIVEIKSLEGDDAIYLCDNYSMSVSALDFPGCLPNLIYFTDDYNLLWRCEPFRPRDIGVFNMEDGSIRSHYTPNIAHKDLPPPCQHQTFSTYNLFLM